MKNILEQINRFALPVILLLTIIMFFRTCSTNNAVNKIEKRVNSIDSATSSTASKQEVDSIVKSRLYDFLIFEEDLDRGKTSLTDIKVKISNNEK